MRTAARIIGTMIALGFGTASSAAGQATATRPSAVLTCVVTAEVKSFVRLVSVPADPATGAPPRMAVVTNDPRIRAMMTHPLSPETIGPESVAFTTQGAGHGGESAVRGRFEAGVTTLRYTFTTP